MTAFRYRAATAAGDLRTGSVEGESAADVLEQLRRLGLIPIEASPMKPQARGRGSGALRPVPGQALSKTLGQLAVMLDAGVALDRSLGVLVEDMPPASAQRAAFEAVLRQVKEGRALSRAMTDAGRAFPPMAAAMTAAGEADGRPGAALGKLAATLDQAQALRSTLISAMVYPLMLMVIAVAVIALMLFWVVPQFEGLFTDAQGSLPPMTRVVLAVSHGARDYGLFALLALAGVGVCLWRLLRRPDVRSAVDRIVLGVPRLGELVTMAECARFVRVLASLVGGGVGLPEALAISRRSLLNSHMAAAVDKVAKGLREGEGLTEPLAATGVFPKLALSYLRTGEQTAQLPLMLERLADTLDRDVRTQVERRDRAAYTPDHRDHGRGGGDHHRLDHERDPGLRRSGADEMKPRTMQALRRDDGFTLLELLVVLAILGLLAGHRRAPGAQVSWLFTHTDHQGADREHFCGARPLRSRHGPLSHPGRGAGRAHPRTGQPGQLGTAPISRSLRP